MAAQSKLELILELKERMRASFSKVKNDVKGSISSIKGQFNEFKMDAVDAFSALKDQIPFLGQFASLLANPWALAAAAVVAFTALLHSATVKAAEFNYEFLDIKQLNLDKSKSELGEYRELILDTAYDTGLAAKDMSKAFYDIQSGTGLFGDDVKNLASQVGLFSKATKADLGASVNSTIKAMKTFGFSVKDTTAYLESNAKTVQVGITTFNELAQVQTEYAGAAKAAGQDFNTANKLFAAFTSSAKDSATAATLTKSAFQGLTSKPTIDGINKIGVNVFDANKNMRNLDVIIRELIPKIKTMSDEQFLTWRNAIGGPEGLQNLFNNLRTSGTDVLATLDAFDKSAFNVSAALQNAKDDYQILKKELSNKVDIMLTKIGNEILPFVIEGLRYVISLADRFKGEWEKMKPVVGWIGNVLKVSLAPLIITIIATVEILAFTFDMVASAILRAYKFLTNLWEGIKSVFTQIADGINMVYLMLGGKGNLWDNIFGTLDKWGFKIKIFWQDLVSYVSIAVDMIKAASVLDFKETKEYFDKLRNFKFRNSNQLYIERETAKDTTANATSTTAENSASASADNFSGGATSLESNSGPVRNLTVNIDSFVKELNVRKDGDLKSMSESELELWFNDMILRTIRNVETSAG